MLGAVASRKRTARDASQTAHSPYDEMCLRTTED